MHAHHGSGNAPPPHTPLGALVVLVSLASNLAIGTIVPRWLAGPGEARRMTLSLAYIRTGFGLIAFARCRSPGDGRIGR